jgi:uncharacterized protein
VCLAVIGGVVLKTVRLMKVLNLHDIHNNHPAAEAVLGRSLIYVGSSDTWGGQNLAIAIVERCRKLGMAGATVSRGIMGFGKHSVIHRAHLLGLSDDLPEKIEIVDRPEEIDRLLPVLDETIGGGFIAVDDVHVVRDLHEPKGAMWSMP